MGGLWVDYNLMTNIKGLFAGGEANFSDHGANRLGASALMQGLADGYFILPQTVASYLARNDFTKITDDTKEVKDAIDRVKQRLYNLQNAKDAQHSPEYFHQKLGKILWDTCGMSREKTKLEKAISDINELKEKFWQQIKITGTDHNLNQTLERAGRVADFIELGVLMCKDALTRQESCGCHARVEYLSKDGEAKRDDENYSFVTAWQHSDEGECILNKEFLTFEFIQPTTRNYK